jgi:patatin-related protein
MPSNGQHTQEVRFAVVLYGGVSLAIYINGVVQELLRLVRSTALPPQNLRFSETVYRKLGSILEHGVIPRGGTQADERVRTKFKVDVISGTSAGGINGVFLAKALANNSNIDALQDLWFDEGGIEQLLNDGQSYEGVGKQPPETDSLLNSRRMYKKLLDALDQVDGEARNVTATSPLTDEIDLFATTTDIEGVPVPIQLLDNVVFERRYRNAFHLRFREQDTNDFEPDNNPFLAFAARCTSSFPFAFDPMRLCDIDEFLTSHRIYATRQYCLASSERWQKYYTNYLEGVFPGATPFTQRSFGDGGYLNNYPFSYAVDTLLTREADVPVHRKLVYIEPSPQHPEEQPPRTEKPDAIENSIAALVTIPGYQTIRNDLTRVLDRNAAVTKVQKTTSEVEFGLQQELEKTREIFPEGCEQWEIWFQPELSYQGYFRMRAAEVTDGLALMVARMRSIDEGSALFVALRSLVRAAREREYGVDHRRRGPVEKAGGVTKFLRAFDLPYRLRRLRFVIRKLDALYAIRFGPGHPAHIDALSTLRFGLNTNDPAAELPAGLPRVRQSLADQYRSLRNLMYDLLRKRDTARAPTEADPFRLLDPVLPPRPRLVQVLSEIVLGEERANQPRQLVTEPTSRAEDEPRDIESLYDRRAQHLLEREPQLLDYLRKLSATLEDLLADVLRRCHKAACDSFAVEASGSIAARYYYWFDLFDAVQYPMMFGTDIGEADIVEIIRIAPEDAASLTSSVAERRDKLKGLAIAHFGAFLDRDWRVSDLLWGRLDAAERIISALLPWQRTKDLRDRLIDEAHSEIFREFEARRRLGEMAVRQAIQPGPETGLDRENVQQVIAAVTPPPAPPSRPAHRDFMQVWRDVVPGEVKPELLLKTLARGTAIIGRMLDAIADRRKIPAKTAWITAIGRALWGVVEISVPRSAWKLLADYWQYLVLLIAVLLVVGGMLTGQAGLAVFGWVLIGGSVVLATLRWALSSFMRGRSPLVFLASVAIFVLALLAAVGGWQVYKWGAAFYDHAARPDKADIGFDTKNS